MAAGIHSNLILLVYLSLLVQLIAHGIGAREMITHQHDHDEEHNILLVQGRHNSMHVDHHPHPHSDHQMDKMPASTTGFFTINDLTLGKTMLLDFPNKLSSPSSRFLPKEEADLIPFSIEQLPNLLQFFSISHDSPKAKSIEETLRLCDFGPAVQTEINFCATSLESMLDMTGTLLGTHNFRAITTTYVTKSLTRKQNYTISQVPKEVSVPKMMVVCHLMAYPYAVFYCHGLESDETKLFKVSVVGDNGDRVEALAICHMETWTWDRNYLPFRMLGLKPGNPICHFLSTNNVVWVPSTATE